MQFPDYVQSGVGQPGVGPGPQGNNPYSRAQVQGPGYGAGYPRPQGNYPSGYQ